MNMLKVFTTWVTIVVTLLVLPSASFAGEIRYSETLDLKVVRSEDSFQFIEIHNDRELLLFEIPTNEMPFFIQTGEDLVDYQKRKKTLSRVALFGLSTYLYATVRLVLAVGAVLVLETHIPEQDPILTRVSRVDLPYILLSTQVENTVEHSFEYDVREVIDSLVVIYNEFRQRMTPIHQAKERIDLRQTESGFFCNESREGEWNIEFPTQNGHIEKLKAVRNSESSGSVSYSFFLDTDFQSPNFDRNWPGYKPEDSVAVVSFSKAYGNIESIDLGSSLSPMMGKTVFESKKLLANLGLLTNSVNRNLLVSGKHLSQVFNWSLALKSCTF